MVLPWSLLGCFTLMLDSEQPEEIGRVPGIIQTAERLGEGYDLHDSDLFTQALNKQGKKKLC